MHSLWLSSARNSHSVSVVRRFMVQTAKKAEPDPMTSSPTTTGGDPGSSAYEEGHDGAPGGVVLRLRSVSAERRPRDLLRRQDLEGATSGSPRSGSNSPEPQGPSVSQGVLGEKFEPLKLMIKNGF